MRCARVLFTRWKCLNPLLCKERMILMMIVKNCKTVFHSTGQAEHCMAWDGECGGWRGLGGFLQQCCVQALHSGFIVATYNIQAVNVGVNAVNLVLHTNNNIVGQSVFGITVFTAQESNKSTGCHVHQYCEAALFAIECPQLNILLRLMPTHASYCHQSSIALVRYTFTVADKSIWMQDLAAQIYLFAEIIWNTQ